MGITSPSHSCHLAPSHNDMGHETQNPFTLVNVVRLIYAANIQKHAFLAGFNPAAARGPPDLGRGAVGVY